MKPSRINRNWQSRGAHGAPSAPWGTVPPLSTLRILGTAILGGLAAACAHQPDPSPSTTPSLEAAPSPRAAQGRVSIKSEAAFLEYLPDSAVAGKLTCLLEPGERQVFAPPLPLESGEWVFLNFMEKPEPCGFWQGFMKQTDLEFVSGNKARAEDSAKRAESLILPLSKSDVGNDTLASRLIATYGTPTGYARIQKNVHDWYGENREGCVAFASSALRSLGESVPLSGLKGDDPISIVTKPFVEHLVEVLGYQKITDLTQAQPGDIGVTVDDNRAVGYPTHVYVFAEWESREKKIAKVIDNQGFRISRPLLRTRTGQFVDKDPTAYFLRAPTANSQHLNAQQQKESTPTGR